MLRRKPKPTAVPGRRDPGVATQLRPRHRRADSRHERMPPNGKDACSGTARGYTHLMAPPDRSSPQSRRQPVRPCIGTLTLRRKHWIELDGRFVIGEGGAELLRAVDRRARCPGRPPNRLVVPYTRGAMSVGRRQFFGVSLVADQGRQRLGAREPSSLMPRGTSSRRCCPSRAVAASAIGQARRRINSCAVLASIPPHRWIREIAASRLGVFIFGIPVWGPPRTQLGPVPS